MILENPINTYTRNKQMKFKKTKDAMIMMIHLVIAATSTVKFVLSMSNKVDEKNKAFYDLYKNAEIEIKKIRSKANLIIFIEQLHFNTQKIHKQPMPRFPIGGISGKEAIIEKGVIINKEEIINFVN